MPFPREPDASLPRDSGVDTSAASEVGALYAAHCPALIGLLTSIGGSRADAEEVAQDAYLALLRNWTKVRDYDDPVGWVRGAAVRGLISRRRRDEVARRGLRRLWSRSTTHPQEQLGAGSVDLERALAQLSVEHRAVLFLHHVLDLPVDEVARELDVPVGTVKSRLSRARAAIGPLLGESEGVTS